MEIDKAKPITLTIEEQNGDKFWLRDLKDNDFISWIRESISRQTGLYLKSFYLYRNGEQLKDSQSLQELGIKDGDEIRMTMNRDLFRRYKSGGYAR